MRVRLLALAALLLLPLVAWAGAKKPPCKYLQNCSCPSPGITARWKGAYCLYEEHTQDFQNEEVQKCVARPDPPELKKLSACQKNAWWKRRICERLHPMKQEDMDSCTKDKTFIPRFVETGPEGAEPTGDPD